MPRLAMPLPSPPRSTQPARCPGFGGLAHGAAWAVAALLTVLLALGTSGCGTERHRLSLDAERQLEVALLSGTAPAEPPADARFAQLQAAQVEESLQRLIVRPSRYISINRGDPQPLLTPEQTAWARDAIVTTLPRLREEQRLQLTFRDRFNQLPVEVELYGEGAALVYRFTLLAQQRNDDPFQPGSRPATFAQLEPGSGQRYDFDRHAFYLRDTLFGEARRGPSVGELQASLKQAAQARSLAATELVAAQAAIEAHPDITEAAVRLYVERLELVVRSREQGLFSEAEAAERKQRLLHDLTAEPGR